MLVVVVVDRGSCVVESSCVNFMCCLHIYFLFVLSTNCVMTFSLIMHA